MKYFGYLFISTVFALTACQSNETGNSGDVAQDQVYRKYEIDINEESSTATASADFRFAGENGTTLRLSSPAKITANGVELIEGKLLFGGVYYRTETNVPAGGNKVELVYTNQDEEVLSETYEGGKATFTGLSDTFYLGRNVMIPFTFSGGDPADNFELYISDGEDRNLSFYASSNTEKYFEVPGSATDTLAQGTLRLRIVSHKRKNLDNHSTLGGTASFSCTYKPVNVLAVKQEIN